MGVAYLGTSPFENSWIHKKSFGIFTPERDNDVKTSTKNVEPVHSYNAFHVPGGPATTRQIWCERHDRNAQVQYFSVVVLSSSSSGVKTPSIHSTIL